MKSTATPDEIVTLNDERGMQSLLRQLGPGSPSQRAAVLLRHCSEPLLLCTGFPVAGSSETDGPVGAVVLARALQRLNRTVSIVSWPEALRSWAELVRGIDCIELRVGKQRSQRLYGKAITIEACGRVEDGCYENLRGKNVADQAPWFEDAIGDRALISIGDGGNEFGMGSAPASWFDARQVRQPISKCEALVVGQVSNWAVLALVAALSRLIAINLLPDPAQYQAMLDVLAYKGVVDGVSGKPSATEDGFDHGEGPRILERLHAWLAVATAA